MAQFSLPLEEKPEPLVEYSLGKEYVAYRCTHVMKLITMYHIPEARILLRKVLNNADVIATINDENSLGLSALFIATCITYQYMAEIISLLLSAGAMIPTIVRDTSPIAKNFSPDSVYHNPKKYYFRNVLHITRYYDNLDKLVPVVGMMLPRMNEPSNYVNGTIVPHASAAECAVVNAVISGSLLILEAIKNYLPRTYKFWALFSYEIRINQKNIPSPDDIKINETAEVNRREKIRSVIEFLRGSGSFQKFEIGCEMLTKFIALCSYDTIQACLDAGVISEEHILNALYTIISKYIRPDSCKILQLILQHGGIRFINQRSDYSFDYKTPLEFAVVYGNIDCIRILMSHGAIPKTDNNGDLLRLYTEREGCIIDPQVVSLLIDSFGVRVRDGKIYSLKALADRRMSDNIIDCIRIILDWRDANPAEFE